MASGSTVSIANSMAKSGSNNNKLDLASHLDNNRTRGSFKDGRSVCGSLKTMDSIEAAKYQQRQQDSSSSIPRKKKRSRRRPMLASPKVRLYTNK